eukprot:scaffold420580_cov27-Prasinocladus_malaysianus.AAC.1
MCLAMRGAVLSPTVMSKPLETDIPAASLAWSPLSPRYRTRRLDPRENPTAISGAPGNLRDMWARTASRSSMSAWVGKHLWLEEGASCGRA